MKNVAISFKINSLFLFLFFLLGLIATTFGQTDSVITISPESFSKMEMVPQPYGDGSLVEFTTRLEKFGKIKFSIKNDAALGEVILFQHKKEKMEVWSYDFINFSDLPEVNPADTSVRVEVVLKPADKYEFYFKTAEGVTSFIIIREGKMFYEVLNGKIDYVYDTKGNIYENLNGRSADYYKDKINWQYGVLPNGSWKENMEKNGAVGMTYTTEK